MSETVDRINAGSVVPMGSSLKIIGRGASGMTHDPVLSSTQLAQLEVSADREPFDGDARLFRLGIEAQRLSLAYEYDPFFSLSIARVDPLPHHLEAVYSYFLRLPRIRFLLANDPGAGKTIMAGLLLKELKARGFVRRVLIVAPASLTFQWQHEMADKFREKFEPIGGDVLRANYGQNPWQERDQVVTSVSWMSVVVDEVNQFSESAARNPVALKHCPTASTSEIPKIREWTTDNFCRTHESCFHQNGRIIFGNEVISVTNVAILPGNRRE